MKKNLARKLTGQVSVAVETITPEWAAAVLLEQQEEDHRGIKQHLVERFAHDMATGAWRLNGETLILNGRKILDGRHRLSAVVRAKVPVAFLVVRGIEEAAFGTIDSGSSRTPGDVLKIAGLAYPTDVATIGRMCFCYDHFGSLRDAPRRWPTRTELMAYVAQHQETFVQAARWTLGARDRQTLTRRSVTMSIYALTETRPDERALFFGDLVSGVGLKAGSPILTLRERLLRDRMSLRAGRLSSHVLAAYFIKAWNAEMRGESLRLLRWLESEAFPVLECRPPAALEDEGAGA